ncbi:hypothetical protein Landi51_05132 [Colletotrichum acutatum]
MCSLDSAEVITNEMFGTRPYLACGSEAFNASSRRVCRSFFNRALVAKCGNGWARIDESGFKVSLGLNWSGENRCHDGSEREEDYIEEHFEAADSGYEACC